ncbi:apolipoprotein L6-like [Montipora foliosa]|uniref:apolipoprotein L6-like n=1 Tax=Montipora foliosa TaxID=591990 RepID=UPI0035F19F84
MECKSELFTRANALKSMISDWIPKRKATVHALRVLAGKLLKHHHNICKAKVAGSSSTIVGGLVGGVGFGLSFVTGGASLLVAAGMGAALAATGRAVNAGSSLTQFFIEKDTLNTAQKLINEDRHASEAIEKLRKEFEGEVRKNIKYNVLKTGAGTVSILKTCAEVGYKVGARAAAKGGEALLFRGLSKVGKIVHIGGFALSVAKLPLDIHTLVTNSKEIHAARRGIPGNEPEKVKQLQKLADELETEIPSGNKFVEALDELLLIATSQDSDEM